MTRPFATGLPGGHSEWEPPDPFSNSEVKTLCADASVDFVDVKVGHCQALNLMETKPPLAKAGGGFFVCAPGRAHGRTIESGPTISFESGPSARPFVPAQYRHANALPCS